MDLPTTPGKYDYCKVFIRSTDRSGVAQLIDGAGSTIDVRRSDDHDVSIEQDDFILWPTIVDIESPSVVAAVVVERITTVLGALRSAGVPAVAACPFEEELVD